MSAGAFTPLFPAEQIPFIIEVVLDHAQSLKKKHPAEKEDDLSDRLHQRIRRDQRIRSAPFSVHREYRVYDDDEDIDESGYSGRIDFNFVYPGGDQTYFAIEAKRLRVSFPSGFKTLVDEYVSGDQGMMCFINGKYSSTQRYGTMLGYVFDGDISKARSGIKTAIVKHSGKLKLETPPGFKKSTIVLPRKRVNETLHDLSGRKFSIYHILVPV